MRSVVTLVMRLDLVEAIVSIIAEGESYGGGSTFSLMHVGK